MDNAIQLSLKVIAIIEWVGGMVDTCADWGYCGAGRVVGGRGGGEYRHTIELPVGGGLTSITTHRSTWPL